MSSAFDFDGRISRDVLENYLSRAISMAGLLQGPVYVDDCVRMVGNIGAKFIGRGFSLWGQEDRLEAALQTGRQIAGRLHAIDPQIMLQASIFECVTPKVNDVRVPGWVFEAFGQRAQDRCFRLDEMIFPEGLYVDHWKSGGCVPDISRVETRMWFLYLAGRYMEAGCEALHLGQITLIGRRDPELKHWLETLTLIRQLARQRARRRFVLCDAHVSSGVGCFGLPDDLSIAPGGYRVGDKLLLDVHALPLRIKEIPGRPFEAELKVGHLDALYGRSIGGITPSGWSCESLPYLVDIDNYGSTGHGGQSVAGWLGPRACGIDDRYWIWGWDEICWFAHQGEAYRNEWLRYAWRWLGEHDPAAHLAMPGLRHLSDPVDGRSHYYANTASADCPVGQNQEETIKAIWQC
jgi:hypothetical protein